MKWVEAVEAMLQGHHVNRASKQNYEIVGHSDGVPVYECGTEATRLAHAWTHDNKPVRVYQGVQSKVCYVPETDDVAATDWVVVE